VHRLWKISLLAVAGFLYFCHLASSSFMIACISRGEILSMQRFWRKSFLDYSRGR
jgi:hypothetical protein